ncbi:unnamed protein product, partial [Rodentolepis nana]|uniref:Rab-GAP TBC domain-containing protein n=1 Tax=Rodentolepis nana TaxID=102285 RepID=A0A0R3TQG6_RODNA
TIADYERVKVVEFLIFYKLRSKIFQDLLDTQKIDLNLLRKECLSGCPESGDFRSISWKILLNYLPTEKSLWNTTLSKARKEYEGFLPEFISKKSKSNQSSDHPLSSDPSSYWREYFDDNIVLLQINKDCRRLYPELDFFRRPTQYPCDKIFESGVKISDLRNRIETELTRSHSVATNTLGAIRLVNSIDDHCGTSLLRAACDDEEIRDGKHSISNGALDPNAEFHWEVVQRILFTSYKMNRASSYVQGMNEIAAPIYYVFANNPDPNERRFAEHDAFFCFNNLMVEIQSVFNRNFDQDFGIGSKMETMLSLLGELDADLLQKLNRLHLEPAHFAFRWITLLLTREFLLPGNIELIAYLVCCHLTVMENHTQSSAEALI